MIFILESFVPSAQALCELQGMSSVSGSTFVPRLRTASFDAPASRHFTCQQISMAAGSRKKSVGDLKKADLEGKKVRTASGS